jgi:hypothetical protein
MAQRILPPQRESNQLTMECALHTHSGKCDDSAKECHCAANST